jgi:group I intron endonuclease
MACGIYKIENLKNGKVYIGQSVNIEQRWAEHRSAAKKLDHPLYRAFRKYGIGGFSFAILEEVEQERLTEVEDFYLQFYKNKVEVYNVAPVAGSTYGFRHSEETKKKLAAQRIGIPLSDEHRESLSRAQRNSEATAIHCREMAAAKIGIPHTPEHRAKIGAKSKGRPMTEEAKSKLSASHLGKKLSDGHKAKISAGLVGNQNTLGHKLSDEHKAKVSKSLIGNKRRLGIKHTPESKAAMLAGRLRRKMEAANDNHQKSLFDVA